MEAYLIDTMFASALWDEGDANHSCALGFVTRAATQGDLIYVSRISLAEIEYGYKLYISAEHHERRTKAEVAMRAFKAIRDVGKDTTEPYAEIRAALFRQFAPRDTRDRVRSVRPERLVDKTTGLELGIQENDLWIAAIAVEHNMTLVSGDRMTHIKQVYPQLKFLKWDTSG